MLTGLTPAGFGILQSYVDRTGDVQTAAILAAHAVPAKFTDLRATRWLEAYRDLLDSLKLHHHRVALDIARGARAGAAFVPRQALIRCNFCGKSVGGPSSLARTGRVRPVYVLRHNDTNITSSRQHAPTVDVNCRDAQSVSYL